MLCDIKKKKNLLIWSLELIKPYHKLLHNCHVSNWRPHHPDFEIFDGSRLTQPLSNAWVSAMPYGISCYIDGLVQERCNSSVLAMELHLSCINPLILDHVISAPDSVLHYYLLYPRSTEGGIGVYWIHPDVCPSVCPSVDKVSGTFWKNYWLNSFHTRHLSLWGESFGPYTFLAATKQLYKWYFPSVCPSVRPSVRLSHLFDYVPLIVSSWNFQELLLMTKVRSMQKVKVRGQRSRSQRSQPNLTVSGL